MTRIGSYRHRYNAIENVNPHLLSLRTESLVAAVIIISTGSVTALHQRAAEGQQRLLVERLTPASAKPRISWALFSA